MAVCSWCGQEMLTGASCIEGALHEGDVVWPHPHEEPVR